MLSNQSSREPHWPFPISRDAVEPGAVIHAVANEVRPPGFHLEIDRRRSVALAIVEAIKSVQNSLTESNNQSKHANVFRAVLGYGFASLISAFLGFYWIHAFYIVSVFAGIVCRFVWASEVSSEQRRQVLYDRLDMLRFQWRSNGLESSSFDELLSMTRPDFIFKGNECGVWWGSVLVSISESVRNAFGLPDNSQVTNSADDGSAA